MNHDRLPLFETLAWIDALGSHHVAPDGALAELRALRAQFPDVRMELVWDEDFAGRPQYEVLLDAAEHATVCMSIVRSDAAPLPMRGMQRWTESQLVAVDGRRVFVHEAMRMLDVIWNDARLLERIVDGCIVDRQLENDPIEIDADALQTEVDRFRAAHGLFDPDETERWLAARGMTVGDLEAGLERELAARQLARRVAGVDAAARFAEDPRRYDRISLVALPVADLAQAHACIEALRAGTGWFELAERVLSARTGTRGERSLSFETMRRRDVAILDDGAAIAEGELFAAELAGRGPYVAHVRSITAAALDDDTRTTIEHELFAQWLARARVAATVEWNWGPRKDAT